MSAAAARGSEEGEDSARLYKFLLAVDLRRFDAAKPNEDWTGGTMVCAGGAIDFAITLKDSFVEAIVNNSTSSSLVEQQQFWNLARQCREETLQFIKTDKVRETAIMFDWGMNYVDIREIMKLEAVNPKTLGRLYSTGLSNMGVFKYQTNYAQVLLKSLHYATSHTVTGILYQLSCGTINGDLFCTFQFTEPITSRNDGEKFASRAMELINQLSSDLIHQELKASEALYMAPHCTAQIQRV